MSITVFVMVVICVTFAFATSTVTDATPDVPLVRITLAVVACVLSVPSPWITVLTMGSIDVRLYPWL